MKNLIRLKSVTQEGKKISYRFESSLRFFKRHDFYVLYDRECPPASAGILAVPFAAVMACLSWMTGADLEMEVLDENYARSLQKAREYFQRWFSKKWSFAGSLRAQMEKNEGRADRDGVLYSGGLDALTTYLRHRHDHPILFSYFGADIPLDQTRLVSACRRSFHEFADSQNLELCLMESDLWTLFDHKDLRRWTHNWWGETSHAMVMSALTAPVSYRELRRLWIASSHVAGSVNYGWGSDYDLDRHLSWGSTQLEHDFHETPRFEKMQYFRSFPEYHRFLRVCYTWWKWTGDAMNCGRCEKCYRSICELLLNGIDPAGCNFIVTEDTFLDIRTALEKWHVYYSFFGGNPSAVVFWTDLQKACRTTRALDLHGSGKFFKWLADFKDLGRMRDTPAGRLFFEARRARWEILQRIRR